MDDAAKRFQRKVKTRQFAIENSWQGTPPQPAKIEAEIQQPIDENQRRWNDLIDNLLAADASKYNDGYFPLQSHRKILGPVIVFLKKVVRKLIKIFFGWYLFPIYARQSHFNGKILNAVAIEQELLCSLSNQIVTAKDQAGMLQREIDEARQTLEKYRSEMASLAEKGEAQLAELRRDSEEAERQLAELRQDNEAAEKQLVELRQDSEIVKKRLVELGQNDEMVRDKLRQIENLPTDDNEFYHDFEERFRGSRDEIKNRLQIYIPYIKEHLPDWENGRFIDVGSGRGEWLDILRENGAADYIGVDLNARQNEVAESFGHKTVCEDCIQYLSEQPDESIDLVSGFQVIEHLCMSDLMELLRQSYRVLKKGGMILFETPNPVNLTVGADTFYIDPSHKRPLDPRMMVFIAQWCGFDNAQFIGANAHPNCSGLSFESSEGTIAENINKVNQVFSLLFGPMDYGLFAVKE